jgi:hypothetical protein
MLNTMALQPKVLSVAGSGRSFARLLANTGKRPRPSCQAALRLSSASIFGARSDRHDVHIDFFGHPDIDS